MMNARVSVGASSGWGIQLWRNPFNKSAQLGARERTGWVGATSDQLRPPLWFCFGDSGDEQDVAKAPTPHDARLTEGSNETTEVEQRGHFGFHKTAAPPIDEVYHHHALRGEKRGK